MSFWSVVKHSLNDTLGTAQDQALNALFSREVYEGNRNLIEILALITGTQEEIIAIPWGTTTIKEREFGNNTAKIILIPNSVKRLEPYAFVGSQNIINIKIPSSILNTGVYSFTDCASLRDVEIQEGVESIGYGSFSECANLENVIIPKSVISIGNYAFGYCYKLQKINLPIGIQDIDNNAFRFCTTLSEVTLPKSLKRIGELAFGGNTQLNDVQYNGTMADWDAIDIHGEAFSGMASLTIHCSDGDIEII